MILTIAIVDINFNIMGTKNYKNIEDIIDINMDSEINSGSEQKRITTNVRSKSILECSEIRKIKMELDKNFKKKNQNIKSISSTITKAICMMGLIGIGTWVYVVNYATDQQSVVNHSKKQKHIDNNSLLKFQLYKNGPEVIVNCKQFIDTDSQSENIIMVMTNDDGTSTRFLLPSFVEKDCLKLIKENKKN